MTADEARELLQSEEYEAVFNKVMTGVEPALLADDERTLLARARELTGTPPPGFPMPGVFHPTRSSDDDD